MYIQAYTHKHTHIHTYRHASARIIYIDLHINILICIHTYACEHTYTNTCIKMHTNTYSGTQKCIHTIIYEHAYTLVYMRVYVNVEDLTLLDSDSAPLDSDSAQNGPVLVSFLGRQFWLRLMLDLLIA